MIQKIFFFLCHYFVVAHSNEHHFAENCTDLYNKEDNGKFYEVSFPFSIDDKQYFYNQIPSKYYQIQELLPGGTVGEVTDFGRSPEFYDVQLSYSICGKQYFYGHRKQSND